MRAGSRPVCPWFDASLARCFLGIGGMLNECLCFQDAQGDSQGFFGSVLMLAGWVYSQISGLFAHASTPYYVRILISFLQVRRTLPCPPTLLLCTANP